MSFFKVGLTVIAASLLGSAVLADTTPPAAPPATGAGHGMMHGIFTQAERMMLLAEMFKATAGMTDDQKHAYRDEQQTRIMSMSDADRAQFKADLDARWNALSTDQKSTMTVKMQAFLAARQAGRATR